MGEKPKKNIKDIWKDIKEINKDLVSYKHIKKLFIDILWKTTQKN